MIKLLLLFFPLLLFASNILTYNIYDRTDRVDIMLTFDTPFEGKIIKATQNHKILIKLYDVSIESAKKKIINSPFIRTLFITPYQRYTEILALTPTTDITLKAAKTADGYGLRLRFLKAKAIQQTSLFQQEEQKQTKIQSTQQLNNIQTQKPLEIPTSYYVVITILFLLVLILFLLKKKISSLDPKELLAKNNLFSQTKQEKIPPQTSQTPQSTQNDHVTIRFQKQLNENSSVVLLDFLNCSYLLLLSTSNNILLDKFIDNQPTTQNEFEAILAEKNEELEQYLAVDYTPQTEEKDIDRFSKKASHIPLDL